METETALVALTALSQEHRLAIFRLLVEHGPVGLAAGDIADELGLAPATLSFHLKELAHARLVIPRQQGRYIYYRANFDAMNALVGYLTENCCRKGACAPCSPAATTQRQRALLMPPAKRRRAS